MLHHRERRSDKGGGLDIHQTRRLHADRPGSRERHNLPFSAGHAQGPIYLYTRSSVCVHGESSGEDDSRRRDGGIAISSCSFLGECIGVILSTFFIRFPIRTFHRCCICMLTNPMYKGDIWADVVYLDVTTAFSPNWSTFAP